jgi:hypothetical protein
MRRTLVDRQFGVPDDLRRLVSENASMQLLESRLATKVAAFT